MKPNKTYSPPENSKIRARKQSYNSILNSSEGNRTFLQAGFTLVELLVVIAILGVLAAAILTAIDPARQIARARDTSRKISIKQIRTALESYRTTIGNYPVHGFWLYSTDPEWQTFLSIELKRAPGDPTQSGCAAGYPWADGYRCWWFAYYSDGTTYDLVSHLENPADADRCEIKQWLFIASGVSWCAPGQYSKYIYAPGANQ